MFVRFSKDWKPQKLKWIVCLSVDKSRKNAKTMQRRRVGEQMLSLFCHSVNNCQKFSW